MSEIEKPNEINENGNNKKYKKIDKDDLFEDDSDDFDPSNKTIEKPIENKNTDMTEEDKQFIDEHDDLQDITNTYANQKEYSDDEENNEFECDAKSSPQDLERVSKVFFLLYNS